MIRPVIRDRVENRQLADPRVATGPNGNPVLPRKPACLNVLHRGHLLPVLSLPMGGSVDLARSGLVALHSLIRDSLQILEVAQADVDEAFASLEGAPTPEDAWRMD